MKQLDKLLPLIENSVAKVPRAAVERLIEVVSKSNPDTSARNFYVLDLTRPSNERRMHCLMTEKQMVKSVLCAHGAGSDPDNDGDVDVVGNRPNSHMSSSGVFRVSETYQMSKHGTACRLDGLEESNRAARIRGVVLHTSAYSTESYVKKNKKCGRSWGCPAVGEDHAEIIQEARDGSYLIIWFPKK